MPQLDKFSYITQIFWVITVIVVFYFVFFKFFLPVLSTTAKFRVKNVVNLQLQQNWYSNLLNNSVVIYVLFFNLIVDDFIYIFNFYKLVYGVYFSSIIEQKANEVSFN